MSTLYKVNLNIFKWNLKYYMNGEERILNTKNILLDNETAYNLIYLSIATNYPDEWDIIKKIDRKIMDNKLMMSYSLLSMLNNNNDKYQQNIENNKDSFYDKDDKKMKSKYLH